MRRREVSRHVSSVRDLWLVGRNRCDRHHGAEYRDVPGVDPSLDRRYILRRHLIAAGMFRGSLMASAAHSLAATALFRCERLRRETRHRRRGTPHQQQSDHCDVAKTAHRLSLRPPRWCCKVGGVIDEVVG